MKFWMKVGIGLVAAFVVQGLLITGLMQVVRQTVMRGVSWPAGTVPPTSYMTASVLVTLIACAAAGITAALIVGRARIRTTLAYGALFTFLAFWFNRATLFADPHPYEWPLIVAPLIAMPLGAWLIVYLKPLPATSPAVS